MKKVAFVASVAVHIKAFHLPYLQYFKNEGYETYAITKDNKKIEYSDKILTVPFERFPFNFNNFKAFFRLRKIFREEKFDIIHCHTPVAAFLTRLAASGMRKKGTKVIYTAHGFHFYKGAPLVNKLIYIPVEWFAAFFTDILITINKEDYEFAKKHLHAKDIRYIPGVGVKLAEYENRDDIHIKKREELSIPNEAKAILSVGELNENKNHEAILKAIAKLEDKNIYYFIAGCGKRDKYLKSLAEELGISHRFILLGYRADIKELLPAFDLFCFPSFREGLPVSVMEAMAAGLPCVVSDVRGCRDLITENKGGFLCKPNDIDSFAEKISKIIYNKELQKSFGAYNLDKVREYSLLSVKDQMEEAYKSI